MKGESLSPSHASSPVKTAFFIRVVLGRRRSRRDILVVTLKSHDTSFSRVPPLLALRQARRRRKRSLAGVLLRSTASSAAPPPNFETDGRAELAGTRLSSSRFLGGSTASAPWRRVCVYRGEETCRQEERREKEREEALAGYRRICVSWEVCGGWRASILFFLSFLCA